MEKLREKKTFLVMCQMDCLPLPKAECISCCMKKSPQFSSMYGRTRMSDDLLQYHKNTIYTLIDMIESQLVWY